jgi:WS/DGAT/MGAT family acyltransferase
MFAALQHDVPQQFGAVLVLEPGADFDPAVVISVLGGRACAVPRLRQRLMKVPPGCGRPLWVDDPRFSIDQHIDHVACPSPGDERAVLDVAAELIMRRLPMDRPLWRASLVSGLADGRVAIVLVAQHALADGVGGLAVLDALVDGAPPTVLRPFPIPPPPLSRLAVDALLSRVRALRRIPQRLRDTVGRQRDARGPRIGRAAACSLLAPTGERRRLAVARTQVDDVRAVAHRHGATVNDVVLSAIAGALHTCLQQRGEQMDTVVVGVPVAIRRTASARELGNWLGEIRAAIPAVGDPAGRLERVAKAMQAGKKAVMDLSSASVVVRAISALGVYDWYMRRQRFLHTVVTNLPGPARPMTLCGATITEVLPLAVGGGRNVTVTFAALSYAGTLAVTMTADPDAMPDLTDTAAALQAELDALTRADSSPSASRRPSGQARLWDRWGTGSCIPARDVRPGRGIR